MRDRPVLTSRIITHLTNCTSLPRWPRELTQHPGELVLPKGFYAIERLDHSREKADLVLRNLQTRSPDAAQQFCWRMPDIVLDTHSGSSA
ncbi:hypothetical protein LZ31DRAFT_205702 [Colletotrichum somersetense]|nr:hypothetical protein LZ31DRAFT_205702 [Colletotrichum somersetense]